MEGKRRKGRLVLSGLLAAFAAVVIGFSWSHCEPHYGGKCLSDWLVERQSIEREVALDAIGTKALPWITHWLTATNPEPQWRQKARTFLRQNTRWSWSFLDPIDEQQLGFTGLYALGTNGAPGAPVVAKLLTSPSHRVQNSAMTA